MQCPNCGEPCGRDEVDVGVGYYYGPYGCSCGWSESEEYNQLTGDGGWQEDGSYLDPYGSVWPKNNPVTLMMRAAEERDKENDDPPVP